MPESRPFDRYRYPRIFAEPEQAREEQEPEEDVLEDEIEEEDEMSARPTRSELRSAFENIEQALVMLRERSNEPYYDFWSDYEAGGRALEACNGMQRRLVERRGRSE